MVSLMSEPSIFAHRGASGYCFENTMCAFEEAYKQGADGIEIDIQLTEDGVPMVIHDMDLLRVAGVRKKISEMTYVEVKKIRIGKKIIRTLFNYRVPTLHEVVLFCETHGIGLNVELKETVLERPNAIPKIVELISDIKNKHISSFHYPLLEQVKKCSPDLETAFLVRKKDVEWGDLSAYTYADGFHLHKRLLIDPYLAELKSTGKYIRVYGMTGREQDAKNPPSYIDGWITDYPDVFVSYRKNRDN